MKSTLTPTVEENDSTLDDLTGMVKLGLWPSGLSRRRKLLRCKRFMGRRVTSNPMLNHKELQERFNKETGKIA